MFCCCFPFLLCSTPGAAKPLNRPSCVASNLAKRTSPHSRPELLRSPLPPPTPYCRCPASPLSTSDQAPNPFPFFSPTNSKPLSLKAQTQKRQHVTPNSNNIASTLLPIKSAAQPRSSKPKSYSALPEARLEERRLETADRRDSLRSLRRCWKMRWYSAASVLALAVAVFLAATRCRLRCGWLGKIEGGKRGNE